jgi:hypothetical protein
VVITDEEMVVTPENFKCITGEGPDLASSIAHLAGSSTRHSSNAVRRNVERWHDAVHVYDAINAQLHGN